MERISWVEHKGKKILFIDYTNLRSTIPEEKAETLDVIKRVKDLAEESKGKILFLSDVTNATPDKDVLDALKDLATFTNSRQIVEKECVVGLSSMQKVLMNIINLVSKAKLTMFGTVQEAKDWLVGQ
jgi:uncharacterized protein YjgD (DUF1641 family)